MGVPAPPGAVARLVALAAVLERDAVPRGYLGPREGSTIIDRHVLDCARLAPLCEPPLVDVGSGAGLPGLVLAALSDERVVLVESQARRASFLRATAREIGVEVEVVRERAEDTGRGPRRESFATATARALAEPAVALELVVPLVRVGGRALVMTGSRPPDMTDVAEELGASVRPLEVAGADGPRWVMMAEKLHPTPERYPRRPGVPERRPLGS